MPSADALLLAVVVEEALEQVDVARARQNVGHAHGPCRPMQATMKHEVVLPPARPLLVRPQLAQGEHARATRSSDYAAT